MSVVSVEMRNVAKNLFLTYHSLAGFGALLRNSSCAVPHFRSSEITSKSKCFNKSATKLRNLRRAIVGTSIVTIPSKDKEKASKM